MKTCPAKPVAHNSSRKSLRLADTITMNASESQLN
jgi:hypothetical protein